MERTRLTDLIAPSFYGVHRDIKRGGHTYYDLYGGRGSTKSSFVSVEIVFGMMNDECANAVVFRKYAVTLHDTVYEQIQWAIDALGVSDLWETKKNPLRFIYTPTKQKIIFKGLDKPKKTKSIKSSQGYFKYLWFEELDEFAGAEEIRTVQQSVLRGGSKFVVFKTFNPPISRSNWANMYVEEPKEDSLRHKSDYTTVPVEWLGQQFIDDAEHLKSVNPRAYEHEYLGNPVGLGTNIFEFLEIRKITDEEIEQFDRIYQGVDWGFFPDAYAFIRLHYEHNHEKIYIFDENYVHKQSNSKTGQWILGKGYDDYVITCDSAEPKSINDYRDMGIPAQGAVKGAGSVEYGMKWLQSRYIVIDPERTPNTYREFINYEFDVDANGEVMGNYPDRDDHTISAVRYSLSPLYNRRGNSA